MRIAVGLNPDSPRIRQAHEVGREALAEFEGGHDLKGIERLVLFREDALLQARYPTSQRPHLERGFPSY
jgi:hypothetical protein